MNNHVRKRSFGSLAAAAVVSLIVGITVLGGGSAVAADETLPVNNTANGVQVTGSVISDVETGEGSFNLVAVNSGAVPRDVLIQVNGTTVSSVTVAPNATETLVGSFSSADYWWNVVVFVTGDVWIPVFSHRFDSPIEGTVLPQLGFWQCSNDWTVAFGVTEQGDFRSYSNLRIRAVYVADPTVVNETPVAGDSVPAITTDPFPGPWTFYPVATSLAGQEVVGNPVEYSVPCGSLPGAERLSGPDRFATSAAISASSFAPGVSVTYVAFGRNFPDALSAAPVAGIEGGPILLTETNTIPEVIRAELDRLNPGKIVILGDVSSVSDTVKTALAAYTTGAVERLSGPDRFATSAAISASSFAPGVSVTYVAFGRNFPDALSAAPVAGIEGGPILLTETNTIPEVIRTELDRLNPGKIVILGDVSSVSDTVKTELAAYTTGAVERLSGPDRFATSAAISASSFAPGVSVTYVAFGRNFPDALSAAPVAGIEGGPILLTETNTIPEVIRTELDRLNPGKIVILGDVSSVSDTVKTALAAYVTG